MSCCIKQPIKTLISQRPKGLWNKTKIHLYRHIYSLMNKQMSEYRWSSKRKINRTCHEHSRSKHLKQIKRFSVFYCFGQMRGLHRSHFTGQILWSLSNVLVPFFQVFSFSLPDFDYKVHISSPTEHHKVSFFLLEWEIASPPLQTKEQFLMFENQNRFLVSTYFTAHLMNGSPGWWVGDESEDGSSLLWLRVLCFESSLLPLAFSFPCFLTFSSSILAIILFQLLSHCTLRKSRHSFIQQILVSLTVFSALLVDCI